MNALAEAFNKIETPAAVAATKPRKTSKPPIEDSKRFAKELSTLTYGIAKREHEVKAREEARVQKAVNIIWRYRHKLLCILALIAC